MSATTREEARAEQGSVNAAQPAHPRVSQLRYARREFRRGFRTMRPEDAEQRPGDLNSVSWSVGHLAWQEQKYFLTWGQGVTPYPEIDKVFRTGMPGTTPVLSEVLAAWLDITARSDVWLDTLDSAALLLPYDAGGKRRGGRLIGNLIQRVTYHYWFHTGMNQAVRKLLGNQPLPQFVGNIDDEAPYEPETLDKP